jgi:hypothetical protein
MSDTTNTPVDPAAGRSDASGTRRRLQALAGLLVLGGCAQTPVSTPGSELAAVQQRLQALEQRVEILDRRTANLPSAPLRSRDEIDKNIQSLEAKRATLLMRFTEQHPEVRETDLSLRLLKLQLDMMDQARKAAP